MIYLKVSPERVLELFQTVNHKLFQRKKDVHWRVREDGSVRAQSVLWLFCWAYNGDGSPKAQVACEEIFNEIMAFSCTFFDATVGYDYAKRFRYSSSDYIEKELETLLTKKSEK